ncbi:ArsR/SmtB family transcription factor [Microbulbifer spongiae]|uniref:Helix-turn-helix domain-containing protein n=1 Tax=Microbulbifer spongiae TaxID=2944933 RepID=A0ABY9EBQ5_9GAMM|nr:helix-turn-helix domain-containing protein [Microbulbifer sp. MI-G]WKD50453.1 helix-turn-helix domain-containing protein [Microbulbifer sp. MI-G]
MTAPIVSQVENYCNALDWVFHALADPTRRSAIQYLTHKPASVTKLAESFDMALPSFINHISLLENPGLISWNKTGRVRICKIKAGQLTAAER